MDDFLIVDRAGDFGGTVGFGSWKSGCLADFLRSSAENSGIETGGDGAKMRKYSFLRANPDLFFVLLPFCSFVRSYSVYLGNRYPGAACDSEAYCYLPMLEETGYVGLSSTRTIQS